MPYTLLKTVHVLAVVVWIGGMVFAHFFLRPALAQLDPPQRLRLMHDVLGRFFRAVLVASLLVLASGVWMLDWNAEQVRQTGGVFTMPLSWYLMAVLGTLMVAIFLAVRLVPYRRLERAVAAADGPAGASALALIRRWVALNLGLGVVVLLVTLLRWPA